MYPTFIPRTIYLDRIKPFIDKQIIKVLTGQRRVGKSYLLFQLMDYIKQQNPHASFLYINKEDLQFSFIKDASDLNEYVLSHQSAANKTYVFIDEIQEIKDFELALRSLLLNPSLDLYCTGSNADLLSGDIAGKLSGRSIEINIYSLSYLEFLLFHQLEDNEFSLDKYMRFGGLPYLKHLALEDDIVFEYLKNIYSTIVFRDIINRYKVRNTVFLEQLILFLASNTGSLFSAKRISDYLKSQQVKIAPNQVQLYLDHLSKAFLIHKVPRYDIEGKRIFEIGEKYYFENQGIRNALWGYRMEDRAKLMENIVFNHLLIQGYDVKVGNLGSLEIDFIAEKKGEKKYIQVALSMLDEKTIEREFGNLQKIKDNYPKLVITMDEFSGNTVEGIENIGLRRFLSMNWNGLKPHSNSIQHY
jgi:predicted AAA+ superfamily ATPase